MAKNAIELGWFLLYSLAQRWITMDRRSAIWLMPNFLCLSIWLSSILCNFIGIAGVLSCMQNDFGDNLFNSIRNIIYTLKRDYFHFIRQHHCSSQSFLHIHIVWRKSFHSQIWFMKSVYASRRHYTPDEHHNKSTYKFQNIIFLEMLWDGLILDILFHFITPSDCQFCIIYGWWRRKKKR